MPLPGRPLTWHHACATPPGRACRPVSALLLARPLSPFHAPPSPCPTAPFHAPPSPCPTACPSHPPLQCGSCWAYSAVAALEARVKIQTGAEWNLSEQEMIDCVNNVATPGYGYYSNGCSGG